MIEIFQRVARHPVTPLILASVFTAMVIPAKPEAPALVNFIVAMGQNAFATLSAGCSVWIIADAARPLGLSFKGMSPEDAGWELSRVGTVFFPIVGALKPLAG